MLRILVISPWCPWPPHDGARIRILETLRYLGERHDVTFCCHLQNEEEGTGVEELKPLCREVHAELLPGSTMSRLARVSAGLLKSSPFIESIHFNSNLAKKVRQLTAEESFDVVHVEFSFLARYLDAIAPVCKAKRVLSTHNIESQRFHREIGLAPFGFRKLSLMGDEQFFPRWEEKALLGFDGATAVSDHDEQWIQRHNPTIRTRLVPNGVDTRYFAATERSTDSGPPSIAFTGVMDYPPNVDAVTWFVKEAWPRIRARHSELRFKIVGAKPSPEVEALEVVEGVEVTGSVPDIRPYVQEASAFVVPLRSGGGTRLKILQAFAMKCPVISTHLGAEGLDVTNDEHLIYADSPGEFLVALDKVLASDSAADGLRAAARQLVLDKYDWQSVLGQLDNLYEELLAPNGV